MNQNTPVPVIQYYSEDQSEFTRYVFKFIFLTLGIRSIEKNDKHVQLYYGDQFQANCPIVIPIQKAEGLGSYLSSPERPVVMVEGKVQFDVIQAIGFFLKDKWNTNSSKKDLDRHGRLTYKNSFQSKNMFGKVPPVNLYMDSLRNILQEQLSIRLRSPWPHDKKCAIGLSHDVDLPDKYAILDSSFYHPNKNLKFQVCLNLKKIKGRLKKIFDQDPDNFWLFEDIIEAERKRNFKSTFFFASMNMFGEWGSIWDVAYDLRNLKFRQIFEMINAFGFEVALHASYNSYQDAARIAEERKILKEICGRDIKGVRHHYWHLGKNPDLTLQMHETAGLAYDSSLAFNDAMGFRRNVALPYYPWLEVQNRPLHVMQIPVFCMDGNIFYRFEPDSNPIETIQQFLQVIKNTSGVGVLDWHVRTSVPRNNEFRLWGETYLKILELLYADSEIWVTSLEEIYTWVKKRECS